jgi:hypothetical protein
MVLVICSREFIENGKTYARGELLEISEERAKELDNQGHLIKTSVIFGKDYAKFLLDEYAPQYPNGEVKTIDCLYI